MKHTDPDPLALPEDWEDRVNALLPFADYRRSWHAAWRAAWEACAAQARTALAELVGDLLRGIVSAKDARIAALERDNALLKAQLEELEESRAPK